MRTNQQKIDCIRRVVLNAREHVRHGDPKRVYSQYIRYALDEMSGLNFCTSVKARGLKRKDVVHEHVVPHSVVMGKLLSLKDLSDESIMSIINKFYILCAITKDEDRLLSSAGYRSKMPVGWDEDIDSVFARYESVGIVVFSE